MVAACMVSSYLGNTRHLSLRYVTLKFQVQGLVACPQKVVLIFDFRRSSQVHFHHLRQPFVHKTAEKTWYIRSSADGNGLNSSSANSNGGTTRLIKAIQAFQVRLISRVDEIRKDLPIKLLFFLVGFYCATAFSTVIGQTGDWDILSAGLAVVVVEGIGALMYRGSIPVFRKFKNLISIVNFWKAGISMDTETIFAEFQFEDLAADRN